jgi:hypothetical protein
MATDTLAFDVDGPEVRKVRDRFNNTLMFRTGMLAKLPMAWLAGLRVANIDANECRVTVPYRWMTQNPFRSTYFAVLAMAGEMSTGALALQFVQGAPVPVSMLIVEMDGQFTKKATDVSTFVCSQGAELSAAVAHTLATGEAVTVRCESIGTNRAGDEVARFHFTWSVKKKRSRS